MPLCDLYKGKPFFRYFDGVDRLSHILFKEEQIVPSEICEDLKLMNRLWRPVWRSLHADINGQVKNFLVACRTCAAFEGDTIRICVRGSKQEQAGGIWHMSFFAYVHQFVKKVQIDFFDYAEIASERVIDDCKLNWIPRPYFGKGEGYDVFIDDAWLGGVVPVTPVSPVYSLKGLWDTPNFSQFLHVTETRYFSHIIDPIEYCPCAVCLVCSECTWDYPSFCWLRDMCSSFGHAPCNLTSASMKYDLSTRNRVLRGVLTNPVFTLSSPSDVRSFISLQEEIPIVKVNAIQVSVVPDVSPEFRTINHNTLSTNTMIACPDVCSKLIGKKVMFMGVHASILGSTPVGFHAVNYYTDEVDAAFISSYETFLVSPRVRHVFLKCSKIELDRIYSYVPTGYVWKDFRELVLRNIRSLRPSQAQFFTIFDWPHVLFENKYGVLCRGSFFKHRWTFRIGLQGPGSLFVCSSSGISLAPPSLSNFVDTGIGVCPQFLRFMVYGDPPYDRCRCGGFMIQGTCTVNCEKLTYFNTLSRLYQKTHDNAVKIGDVCSVQVDGSFMYVIAGTPSASLGRFTGAPEFIVADCTLVPNKAKILILQRHRDILSLLPVSNEVEVVSQKLSITMKEVLESCEYLEKKGIIKIVNRRIEIVNTSYYTEIT